MKRILIMLAVCLTALGTDAQVQYGGEIYGRANDGTRSNIKRDADALKVSDSVTHELLGSLSVSVSPDPNLDTIKAISRHDSEYVEYMQANTSAIEGWAGFISQQIGYGQSQVRGDSATTDQIHHTGALSSTNELPSSDGKYYPLSMNDHRRLRVNVDTSTNQKTTVKVSQLPTVSIDSTTTRSTVKVSQLPVSFSTGATDATTIRTMGATEQNQDLMVTSALTNTVGNNILLSSSGSGSYDLYGTGTKYQGANIQTVYSGTVSSSSIAIEQSNDGVTWIAAPYVYMTTSFSLSSAWGTNIGPTSAATMYISVHFTARYARLRIASISGGGTIGTITSFSQKSAWQLVYPATTFQTHITSMSSGNSSPMKAEDAAASDGFVGMGAIGVRQDTLTSLTSANADNTWFSTDKTSSLITVDQRQHRRTYSCAFSVVPDATGATDIVEIVGSSSKTVFIHSITISGTQTTGGGVPIYIVKRSTAASGGTSTNKTITPRSTILAEGTAATAVVKAYTANPTTGTLVGNIWLGNISTPATTGDSQPYRIQFNDTGMPVKLSGTSQTLCVNLNGATVTGGTFYITIEFSETGE